MGEVTAEEIAAALYTTPRNAVQRAKEWGDELHKLRSRLVSWASSYRLIECELTGRLDTETPFDAARSNAITTNVIDALKELSELRRDVSALKRTYGTDVSAYVAAQRESAALEERERIRAIVRKALIMGESGTILDKIDTPYRCA